MINLVFLKDIVWYIFRQNLILQKRDNNKLNVFNSFMTFQTLLVLKYVTTEKCKKCWHRTQRYLHHKTLSLSNIPGFMYARCIVYCSYKKTSTTSIKAFSFSTLNKCWREAIVGHTFPFWRDHISQVSKISATLSLNLIKIPFSIIIFSPN